MSETSSTLSELHVVAGPKPGRSADARSGLRRLGGYALLSAADAVTMMATVAAVLVGAQLVADAVLGPPVVLHIAFEAAIAASGLAVLAANYCLGLYEISGRSAVERFRLRVWSTLAAPPLGLALLALPELGNARSLAVLLLAAIIWLPLSLIAETLVLRWLVARSAWGLRALLIGDAGSTATVAAFLRSHPEVGLRPVGYCGQVAAGKLDDGAAIARLGSVAHARNMGEAADIAIVTLSPEVAGLDLASLPFRRILVLPEATGLPSLWLRSRALGNSPALEFSLPLQAAANLRAKRLLDIMIALPLLVVAAPVIGTLAVAIRLVSPGSAFYAQRRVGFNGKPLRVLKLRSMHLDAERRLQDLLERDPAAKVEWARYVKLTHDPRVLPGIGDFIRRTSLDELPQRWNVLRGDMSIGGPRPVPSYHLEMFDTAFQSLRATVRPGLTGLWQVSERSNADLTQQQMLDTFYIRNWSLWFDLYIAFRTVPAVLIPRGAR